MGRTESRWPNAQALCPDGGCANNAACGTDQSRDLGGSSASGNARSDAGFVPKVESKQVANELDRGKARGMAPWWLA